MCVSFAHLEKTEHNGSACLRKYKFLFKVKSVVASVCNYDIVFPYS